MFEELSSEDPYLKALELAKRRGIFYQSSEIYGGAGGFIDYGPNGARLKANLIDEWRRIFVNSLPDLVYEVETPIIVPEAVLKASGHVDNFTDLVTQCSKCGRVYRVDHMLEELGIDTSGKSAEELSSTLASLDGCPVCGGKFSRAESHNLLFRTSIGPYSSLVGYLRPETAQGIFPMFRRIYEVTREKEVFGIAQVGRVGRNEISPRGGDIRLREFTQMELEFFFDPELRSSPLFARLANERLNLRRDSVNAQPVSMTGKAAVSSGLISNEWLAAAMIMGKQFLIRLGIPEESHYYLEVPADKRAHYSKQTWDLMARLANDNWTEVAGLSYRGDFDLKAHAHASGVDLRAFKRLDTPIVKQEKRFKWDPVRIREKYGSMTGEVIKSLSEMSEDDILRAISAGYFEISGQRIDTSMFSVEDVSKTESGVHYYMHVAEGSFGADRLMHVMLAHALTQRAGRAVLAIPRYLANPQVGVLPLMKKDGLDLTAKDLVSELVRARLAPTYDDEGAIGRRYARLDEVGVPVAVTVDYQTLEDSTVTLRDRDTWEQVRVRLSDLPVKLRQFIYEGAQLGELGERAASPAKD